MDGLGSPPSARTAPAHGTRCDGAIAITPPVPMPVPAVRGLSLTPPPAPLPALLWSSSTPQLAPLPAPLRLSSTPSRATLPTEERLSPTPLLAMRGSAATLSSACVPPLTGLSVEGRASLEISSHEGVESTMPPPAPAHSSARRERKRGRKPAASGSVPLDRRVPPHPALSSEARGSALASSTDCKGPALAPQPLPAPSPIASARSLAGSPDSGIAEPCGVPLPSPPPVSHGSALQMRAVSHSWSSEAPSHGPARPSQRDLAAQDISHLSLLEKGVPVPPCPRLPPHGASASWHAPAPPPPRSVKPDREVRRDVEGASTLDAQPPKAPPPLRILVLFSGAGESESNLPLHLREAGCVVVAIDTKVGGASHDVLRASVGLPLLTRIRASEFDCVFIATPCSSYSVLHDPQLRSVEEPEGIAPIPEEWRAYVRKHNFLADFTASAIDACRASSTPLAVENPADRSVQPAFWEDVRTCASIWRMPCIAKALGASRATFRTFSQCKLGSGAQKWTTVASTGELARELACLGDSRYLCDHISHRVVLEGRDASGRSRAGLAAAYPRGLNALLARALVAAGLARRRSRRSSHQAQQVSAKDPATSLPTISEGRVFEGISLGPVAHAACEAARAHSARFSHARHTVPASRSELRDTPFPCDLANPVVSSRPSTTCKASRRRPLPRGRSPCSWVGCCPDVPTTRDATQPCPPCDPEPKAHTAIASLFLPGVYSEQVLTWLALADEAAASIRAGEHPKPVPTRVLGQDVLQPWARGKVWDCRDPTHCVPISRSTRHTPVPGTRQLNRAKVREVAALLNWHDMDIIDQIGEGGVEVRSDCSLDIVLAFHHDSLLREVSMAETTVRDHIGEEWVAPPVRHLPFVPCRLQPRGVVMQHRARLLPDGITLEEYEKPRITTDSSYGGVDSVNAGVHPSERSVTLPSIQSLAQGWAICQSALDDSDHPAAGYCIDAESAYSFCHIQEADLWTQCFIWWDASARAGVAIDRRMGFGGSFAPNRFERISTFVAAYAQHMQAEFDSDQPAPASSQHFRAHRSELQRRGLLPPGLAQLSPRYLQVFMDDFTGAAGTDPVIIPPHVSHLEILDKHMLAAGCIPSHHSSRVRVHALLTMLALERLGLHAAPHKVACGSPLPALGLLIDASARTIRCPEGKRKAVRADLLAQRVRALEEGCVDRRRAERLVGRLCNLSQVAPSIRRHLSGGYALAHSSWPGSRRGEGMIHPKPGGPVMQAWLDLLDAAELALDSNSGVCMAHSLEAASRLEPKCLTAITDASGEDGFGGYAFCADSPNTIYILSAEWPPFAKRALAASSCVAQARLREEGRASALPHLSMPAAELFAAVVLPRAFARVAHHSRTFAVGDCGPAVGTIDAMHSGNAQMQCILGAIQSMAGSWVSVKVPREANLDADRLSHPAQLDDVVADARLASLAVVLLSPDHSDWALLRDAIDCPPATRPRKRPKRTAT